MDKSEITEKLSAFWKETLTGDGKLFNFSMQDIIELYCEIRAKEDELVARKSQHLLGSKKSLAEVRLKNVKSLKFALSETYVVVTGDDAGIAKLERWYGKRKQSVVEETLNTQVVTTAKKVKDSMAQTYVGLPKNKEFLALSSELYREGVWKGEIKKTKFSQEQLRRFYYILSCDEEILLQMRQNRVCCPDLENRLTAAVKSRLQLKEYFQFNFGADIEVDFALWKKSIRQVFVSDLRKLEKALATASNESGFLEAYNKLVSFWNKFSIFSGRTTESGAVLNLTTEHLPREYHFVCSEQQIEIFGLLGQLENESNRKNVFHRSRCIIRESGCRSAVVEASHFQVLNRILFGYLDKKIVVMQTIENRRVFFCKAI